MQQTFCTKLVKSMPVGPTDILTSYLDEYSELFQKIEHKLYVDLVHKKIPLNKLKQDYQKVYGINARQFNSIRVDLDGKIKSKKELLQLDLSKKKSKLDGLNNKLESLILEKKTVFEKLSSLRMNDSKFKKTQVKYKKIKNNIHYTKRKIKQCEDSIKILEKDLDNNIIRMCFGEKELFQKQFELQKNNYKNHEEWLKDWREARSNQSFFLGSSDESYGNMNCQYNKNNLLKIKTAPFLEKRYGKYIEVSDVYFKYGQEKIDYCKEPYENITPTYNIKKYYNGALNHRFCRKEHGWYLHTSIDIKKTDIKTDSRLGGIGIDFNVNFVAVAFVDRFGNPIDELNLKYYMYGKNTNQITAKLGELCKELCELSLYYKVPMYIEDLSFDNAKKYIDKGKKYNRMINSFPYSKFRDMLSQRALKCGSDVVAVNPAYTSIIGQFKFMKKYGLSSHSAAAAAIARRGMNFKTEKIDLKYKNLVYNSRPNTSKNLDNYKMWIKLSSIIKKNMKFEERIKMLYTF